jgi:uncharacterized Zn finger protein (UPF0148 family)
VNSNRKEPQNSPSEFVFIAIENGDLKFAWEEVSKMAKNLKKLKINTLGSVDTPANQHGQALLFKRAGEPDVSTVENDPAKGIIEKIAEFLKSLGTAPAAKGEENEDVTKNTGDVLCPTCGAPMVDSVCAACAAKAELAKKEQEKDGDKPMKIEDLMKSENLTPEVKAFLQSQEDSKIALEKSLKDTQDAVDLEKAARLDREYLSKAQGFTHLAQKPEEFGPILKGLATKAPDEFAKLEPLLKGWNEAMSQSALFKEVGGAGGAVAGSAEEEINKRAEVLMKADTSLSLAAAEVKVLEADASLYKRYNDEQDAE